MHHILPDWTEGKRRSISFRRRGPDLLLSRKVHSFGLIFALKRARGRSFGLFFFVLLVACFFFFKTRPFDLFGVFCYGFASSRKFSILRIFWFQHFIPSYFSVSNIYTVAVINRISHPRSFWQNEGQHGLRIATQAQVFWQFMNAAPIIQGASSI